MRIDGQAAELEELQARIRARDWYHDLSEQESDEEIRQTVSRAEGQEANVENQSGVENVLSTCNGGRVAQVSQNGTSLLDALFCLELEPCGNATPSITHQVMI